jgi:hypothetical protein
MIGGPTVIHSTPASPRETGLARPGPLLAQGAELPRVDGDHGNDGRRKRTETDLFVSIVNLQVAPCPAQAPPQL